MRKTLFDKMAECFICGSEVDETIKHQDVDKCVICMSEFQAGLEGITTRESNTPDEESEPEIEYQNNLF